MRGRALAVVLLAGARRQGAAAVGGSSKVLAKSGRLWALPITSRSQLGQQAQQQARAGHSHQPRALLLLLLLLLLVVLPAWQQARRQHHLRRASHRA